MPATLVELEIAGGLAALRCPVTGIPVWTEEGFDEEAEQSPFLRFFIDWIGGIWVIPPASLSGEEALKQQALVAALQIAEEEGNLSHDELMKQVCEMLPSSATVFEVLSPAGGGGRDGEICYAGFDFANSRLVASGVKLMPLDAEELG